MFQNNIQINVLLCIVVSLNYVIQKWILLGELIIMKPVALECVLGSEAYHTHKVSDEKVDISKYDGDLEDDNYKIEELFNDTEPRLR